MLVEGISQAIEMARQHPHLSFVTREGDMVTLGGVVTGGSADQAQQGIIHKKREIKELDGKVTRLEQEVATLGEEREELRRQSQLVAEELKGSGARLHQAELKLAGLMKDRQQATEEIGRVEERLALQTMEGATLGEEKEALEAEEKLSRTRLEETGSASQGLEQEVTSLKEALDNRREQLAAVRERVTAIRVRTATLREQHEAHLRGLADLDRQSLELSQRMASDREELEKGAVERVRMDASIAASTEQLGGLLRQQVESEGALTEMKAVYEAAGQELAAAEAQARQAREGSDMARQTQGELNLRFSTLGMQVEHLERGLLEKSRITMAEAVARLETVEFDEAVRQARRVELQKLLDEMGEVNLMAIDECAGMEERFNFLASQKEDLEESLRGLQQAIQRINRTTRQRFQETYNLVNTKFQEVFPRLFCGGRAELRLTNEDDLLETGIDIIVQPPGKKLQNVTLLSGGEKALTAVALIFSIFLIKPTPFCLLDEVDAPLDDANIGRFNDMVREMSAISQFIIITHNKATMQVADTLYGITMEEPGASKVVSVRLN
jgi:chromosome segregation protein